MNKPSISIAVIALHIAEAATFGKLNFLSYNRKTNCNANM